MDGRREQLHAPADPNPVACAHALCRGPGDRAGQRSERLFRRHAAAAVAGRKPAARRLLRSPKAPSRSTEAVLQQMSGLSGAEFVFLDTNQKVLARTFALTPRKTNSGWQACPAASKREKASTAEMGAQPSVELARPRLLEPADARSWDAGRR